MPVPAELPPDGNCIGDFFFQDLDAIVTTSEELKHAVRP